MDEPSARATTILIVDDDASVRALVRHGLERAGYTVITAIHGQQGLDEYRQRRGRIGAIVLDVQMPVLGGLEMLKQLREEDPEIPVLLNSADSEPLVCTIDDRRTWFLRKPYRLSRLILELRQMLWAEQNTALPRSSRRRRVF